MGRESIVSASVEGQTPANRVNIFCVSRGQTSVTQVNSFCIVRRTEVWDVTGVLGIFCEKNIRVSHLW